MSACLSLYTLSLGVTFLQGSRAELAELGIRTNYLLGTLAICSFYLLRLAVVHPDWTVGTIIKRHPLLTAGLGVIVALIWSPWFLHGVTMPQPGNALTIPEPHRGFASILVDVVLVCAMLVLVLGFVRDTRRMRGVRRTESQYLTLATAIALLTGMCFVLIGPHVAPTSQPVMFVSLSFLGMELIVAYGIARHRILAVGEFLRQSTAYALMGGYLVLLYGGVWYLGSLLLGHWGAPDAVPHILAGGATTFSLAPANTFIQAVAKRLFINVRPLDLKSTLRQSNDILRSLQPLQELLDRFSTVVHNALSVKDIRVFLAAGEDRFCLLGREENEGALTCLQLSDAARRYVAECGEALSLTGLTRVRSTPVVDELTALLQRHEARVLVGITHHDRLRGVMLLGPRLSGSIYSSTDLEALQLLCAQLGAAVANAQLYQTVQESKQYNEMLLENLVSGVIAVDQDGMITTLNPEAQRITGLAAEETVGRASTCLPPPLADIVQQACAGREWRDEKVELESDEHEGMTLRVSTAACESHEDGAARRNLLVVLHDVSALTHMEQQLRKSDRLASVGTVAAGMAHEIKNPLVAIKTFTQLLPERYEEADFRDTFSSLIGSEVTRIDGIVNRLLDFARPSDPILGDVHVHTSVRELKDLVEHQFDKKNVRLTCDLQATHDTITADANQIEQALLNLLLNALNASAAGGTVTIRTENADHTAAAVRISVIDSGCGIPPEHVEHVFDPFFTTRPEGTGLGLSVTHRIVQDHAGGIEIDSTPEVGTTVNLTLPLTREAEVPCELAS